MNIKMGSLGQTDLGAAGALPDDEQSTDRLERIYSGPGAFTRFEPKAGSAPVVPAKPPPDWGIFGHAGPPYAPHSASAGQTPHAASRRQAASVSHPQPPQAPREPLPLLPEALDKKIAPHESARMREELQRLKDAGWSVAWEPIPKGPLGHTYHAPTRRIVINTLYPQTPKQYSDTVMHEIDHAQRGPQADTRDEASFVASRMKDEGHAELHAMVTRHERHDNPLLVLPAQERAVAEPIWNRYLKQRIADPVGAENAATEALSQILSNRQVSPRAEGWLSSYGKQYREVVAPELQAKATQQVPQSEPKPQAAQPVPIATAQAKAEGSLSFSAKVMNMLDRTLDYFNSWITPRPQN